jgi:hypothetical protein
VQDYLQLFRKDPAQLETHMNKRREQNATSNAKHNVVNDVVNNPVKNALTALKKRQDHITYMNATVLENPSRFSDTQVHFLVLYYALYRKAVDCGALCMQIQDEVKKSFVIKMVKGSMLATVTDIRSSETLAFDAGAHMVHICTASLDNVDGEAAAFLGCRGGPSYPPIIVCGRFF